MILRLIPVNIYDFPQVEAYFKYMAEKGLFIKKTIGARIGIGRFERGNGEKTKYHLEPIGDVAEKPFDELKSQFENAGWEYICKFNEFYIFKAIGSETRDVQPDPLIRKKEIIKLKNKCFGFLLYGFFYFLFGCGLVRKHLYLNDYPIYEMVKNEVLILIPGTIFWIYWLLKEYKTNKILKHFLENDYDFYKGGEFNPRDKTHILDFAILLIIILALSSYFWGKLSGWKKDLADYKGEKPTISLSTIENSPNLQEIEDPLGKILENTIRFKQNYLASGIYEIQEYGAIEVQEGPDHIVTYSTGIDSEIYNLRFHFLVSAFLEDLVGYKDSTDYRDMECIDLEGTKFDQAYFAKDGDSQAIFASIGKKVIYVSYDGNKDLSEFADEVYQAVVEFE